MSTHYPNPSERQSRPDERLPGNGEARIIRQIHRRRDWYDRNGKMVILILFVAVAVFLLLDWKGVIKEWIRVLIFGAFLAGGLLALKIVNRKDRLQKEAEENSIKQQRHEVWWEQQDTVLKRLLDNTLKILSAKLQFSNDERITLFLIDINRKSQYNIIGRYTPYSPCNDIRRTNGTIYKPFIEKACIKGELYIEGLPEFTQSNLYLDELRTKYEVDYRNKMPKMRMEPRNFYFKAIMEDGHQCGIIMFESRKCNRLPLNDIIKALEEESLLIREFIRHHQTKNNFFLTNQ